MINQSLNQKKLQEIKVIVEPLSKKKCRPKNIMKSRTNLDGNKITA